MKQFKLDFGICHIQVYNIQIIVVYTANLRGKQVSAGSLTLLLCVRQVTALYMIQSIFLFLKSV